MDITQEIWRTGRVIELCNQIELYMTAIIEAYVAVPAERETFLRAYILNSSIISFGSKIKLVLSINEFESVVKLDTESIHKVGNLRNAFAHNDLISSIKSPESPDVSVIVVIESIKSNGQMQTINRDIAFENFMSAHTKAESCLREMLGRLRGV